MKKRNKVGCLVLAVVVCAFGVLLWPTCPSGLEKAKALKAGNCGRQIQLAVLDEALTAEAIGNTEPIWPVVGQYKTSTEFFRSLVANEIIRGIDFSFFGAPGIKHPKDPNDPEKFLAENNAWCVVVLPTNKVMEVEREAYKDAPFLFTKNFAFGSSLRLPQEGDTIADMSGLSRRLKLFGRRKVGVIVTFGGSVKILPEKFAIPEYFNPTGESLQFLSP